MTKNDYLYTVEEFADIYDVKSMNLHTDEYWHKKYNIDIIVACSIQRFASGERYSIIEANLDQLLDFCITALPLSTCDESERIQYLYDLTVKICENECKRIGFLTYSEFLKKCKELADEYDLVTPLPDIPRFRKEGNLQEKYNMYFDTTADRYRQIVLDIATGGKIHLLPICNFFWCPVDKREPPFPMNCYDAFMYCIPRLLEDQGRKKMV